MFQPASGPAVVSARRSRSFSLICKLSDFTFLCRQTAFQSNCFLKGSGFLYDVDSFMPVSDVCLYALCIFIYCQCVHLPVSLQQICCQGDPEGPTANSDEHRVETQQAWCCLHAHLQNMKFMLCMHEANEYKAAANAQTFARL